MGKEKEKNNTYTVIGKSEIYMWVFANSEKDAIRQFKKHFKNHAYLIQLESLSLSAKEI